MRGAARSFLIDENGAATVDWVVLTAAIVSLAIVGLTFLFVGLQTAGQNLHDKVENVQPFTPAAQPPAKP